MKTKELLGDLLLSWRVVSREKQQIHALHPHTGHASVLCTLGVQTSCPDARWIRTAGWTMLSDIQNGTKIETGLEAPSWWRVGLRPASSSVVPGVMNLGDLTPLIAEIKESALYERMIEAYFEDTLYT